MKQNSLQTKRTKRLAKSYLSLDERHNCALSQLLFFVPFGTWIIVNILVLRTTFAATLQPLIDYNLFRMICFATLIARELLFGKWDRLTFLGLTLLAVMCYASVNGNMMIVVESMVFAFSARDIRFRRIALFSFCTLSAIFVITVVSALTGFIADTTIQRGETIRHHLGFGHPNTCNALAFFIFCLWVALRKESFNVGDAVGIIAIAIALYMLTDSRTSLISAIALSILALAIRFLPRKLLRSRVSGSIAIGFIALLAIVSIGLTFFYDPSIGWMKALNGLVSNRLALGHRALTENGIPLLGQKINFTRPKRYDFATGTYIKSGDKSFFIVDCAYVRLLVSCGWIFIIASIALATLCNARMFQQKQWYVLLTVCFVALHGMFESYVYNGTYNIFLMLIGGLLYSPSWNMAADTS